MDQIARDLAQVGITGPVSEPTTPPEYRETGFPSVFSRPTRFSTSSVTTSPGIFNIFAPSQVSSPPTQVKSPMASTPNQGSAPQSVLGSRRNSEEEELIPGAVPTYRPGIPYVFYVSSLMFSHIHFYSSQIVLACMGRVPAGSSRKSSFHSLERACTLSVPQAKIVLSTVNVIALLPRQKAGRAGPSVSLHFIFVSILLSYFTGSFWEWDILTMLSDSTGTPCQLVFLVRNFIHLHQVVWDSTIPLVSSPSIPPSIFLAKRKTIRRKNQRTKIAFQRPM